jgi:UDP-glucose 4-epimerase
MKILVTGGAGFIGSHLCDELVARGHQVVIVDNLSLGSLENIEHLLSKGPAAFYKMDLLDTSELKKLFAKECFDIVFHLAANSDIAQSLKDPSIDLRNTFLSTFQVLDAMREANVKKLVFASTSAIYGETESSIEENYGPLFPASHYGAGKLASEAFISSFASNYGMQVWLVRFPNVVGERATHGAIFDFIKKLRANGRELVVLGNGEQNKPYLYVQDLVGAIMFIWENSAEALNYYNIGVESRTKVKDIARIVVEEMGLDASIKYTGGDRGWVGDVPQFSYSLEKIHKLGWRASYSSDEAVRLSVRRILGTGR